MSSRNEPDKAAGNSSKTRLKWSVFAVVALSIAVGYWIFGDTLRLERLAANETLIRQYGSQHPVLVYGIAWIIYVAVTGLSLPGAAVLTLVYGWYFGWIGGLILVSFASTAGATLAFLLSRYLLRDTIENRFGEKLRSFNDNLRREGAFYLFTLRLIPAVPFFVINGVMGLTPMKPVTFWWVSQISMLPGTAVYVYAGSTFPTLSALAGNGAGGVLSPQLLLAFILLGVFPLVLRRIAWLIGRRGDATGEVTSCTQNNASPWIK